MAQVIGAKEYSRWKRNKFLTLKGAVLANCYQCNGFEDSSDSCLGINSCPLFAYSPYGRKQGLHCARDQFPSNDSDGCQGNRSVESTIGE